MEVRIGIADGRIYFNEDESVYVINHGGNIDRFIQVSKVFKAAQHSVQRIAFGAFTAGVLVGVVVTLIVVFVQIGVR